MNTATLQRLGSAVEAIHGAAMAPETWPQALACISRLHGSDKAMLVSDPADERASSLAWPCGFSASAVAEWRGVFRYRDPWEKRASELDLRAGVAAIDTDLVPDRELLESTFYCEFLRPLRIGRMCTGRVFDRNQATHTVTNLSIYAPRSKPFNEESRDLHRLMLGQVARAIALSDRLHNTEQQLAATLAALDHLPTCIVMLAPGGEVNFANSAARRLLAEKDGLMLARSESLRGTEGTLRATCCRAHVELKLRLGRATGKCPDTSIRTASTTCVPRSGGKPALILHLVPLSESSLLARADRETAALACIIDPASQTRLAPEVCRQLFAFTPAETRLANNLLVAESLQEIAARTAVSQLTLRKQLQSLFGKTQTRRQSELVRLMASIATTP